ncbi:peptide-methionine (S)-S-oxide reductase MsrA [Macrococcoides caseolyticum]|uniref:peptide-methionine (S)-S-oxide reductase MsrA n=1 Tax=Macrococcoides caseolyticum TaxID=69966 RepID=UPI001F3D3DE1|nr:peptide-methionine (S)-S-oxide reductase MsrA [Macrococcus caseolyticus]MCE4957138.1 peptide-methionine (S)-S-oxide reductase MsrA [Macrococcus caseolyticus]
MEMNTVYFAGGCFWCMVKPFDSYPGIHGIKSGFMGGHVINPTYLQVKEGTTGHLEVVKIDYDEHIFSFEKLLDIFFSQIDPTDDGGQFMDRGAQYRTAVFYTEAYQAEQSLNYIKHIQSNYNQPIVTDVRPAETFYMAEEEHQDFYKKQPERYKQEQEDRKNYIETQKNLS